MSGISIDSDLFSFTSSINIFQLLLQIVAKKKRKYSIKTVAVKRISEETTILRNRCTLTHQTSFVQHILCVDWVDWDSWHRFCSKYRFTAPKRIWSRKLYYVVTSILFTARIDFEVQIFQRRPRKRIAEFAGKKCRFRRIQPTYVVESHCDFMILSAGDNVGRPARFECYKCAARARSGGSSRCWKKSRLHLHKRQYKPLDREIPT